MKERPITGREFSELAWREFDLFCQAYKAEHPDEEPDMHDLIKLYGESVQAGVI